MIPIICPLCLATFEVPSQEAWQEVSCPKCLQQTPVPNIFLSPRMIQALEILQLPVVALRERIEHELEENPVLELGEPSSEDLGSPNAPEASETIEIAVSPLESFNCETPEVEWGIDPKSAGQGPDTQFVSSNVEFVVPDIIVEKNDQSEFDIQLADDWTSNAYIGRQYIEMLHEEDLDAKTREWLQFKIQTAKSLIDAIEQRRSTMIKVTTAIIQHQRTFLDKGPEFIELLELHQIAEIVSMHVTTVSRAVEDKWMQTPQGIFPLNRFFGGSRPPQAPRKP